MHVPTLRSTIRTFGDGFVFVERNYLVVFHLYSMILMGSQRKGQGGSKEGTSARLFVSLFKYASPSGCILSLKDSRQQRLVPLDNG